VTAISWGTRGAERLEPDSITTREREVNLLINAAFLPLSLPLSLICLSASFSLLGSVSLSLAICISLPLLSLCASLFRAKSGRETD
jgi:hypothetical protein